MLSGAYGAWQAAAQMMTSQFSAEQSGDFPVQVIDGTGSIADAATLERLCASDANFLQSRMRTAQGRVLLGDELLRSVRSSPRQPAAATQAASPARALPRRHTKRGGNSCRSESDAHLDVMFP